MHASATVYYVKTGFKK